MILIGFIFAAVNGNIESVTKAAFDGAQTGVTVSFGLISILVFWLGMMRLAEDAGLLKKVAKRWARLSASCSRMYRRIIPLWGIYCPT